ncbi:MAG: class III cytochrome C family protein [bacterium]|nr:class III cytochrome C family protein [bacterium]
MKRALMLSFWLLSLFLMAAWIWPEVLLSPGPLIPAHAEKTQGCLDCHQPGAMGEACVSCHRPQDFAAKEDQAVSIGKGLEVKFHQQMKASDCLACHGEHGPITKSKFGHKALPKPLLADCQACHATPKDRLHEPLKTSCATCHNTQAFKPARMDHEAIANQVACASCHQPPKDRLHQQSASSCGDCHGTKAFKPANFEHSKWFRFDRHHPADCKTCHLGEDYKTYSCTECHEHSLSGLRGEHAEEGIRDLSNCAECHRTGDEHDARRRRSSALGAALKTQNYTPEAVAPQKGGSREYKDHEEEHKRKDRREHDDD